MFIKKAVFFLFMISLILPASGYAGEGRWEEPWGKQFSPSPREVQKTISPPSPGQRAAEGLIRIFQKYISPVDGDRCPCYPTCSQYSVEAIRKHGAVIGLVMTFDRFMHESDEIRRVPLVKVYDSYRYYDPVENNDFWWDKNSGQQSALSNQR
jgi:putative component of membrane protein insertase Oxa1/YidC/SpoIIIJ protein YidD